MSEAIILYRGRGGVSEEDKKPKVYTSNGTFVAPFTGNYMVSCVGGGGGGGGGCRNIWNSSQVYYGAGGSRGGLSSGNVWLNQGDQVTLKMGAGGTAGTNNTTVVSYNSKGTSGSTGSTTTFGSHKSGSGGSGGSYSWMYRTTYNINMGWNNIIVNWNNTGKYEESYFKCNHCGSHCTESLKKWGSSNYEDWEWTYRCTSCGRSCTEDYYGNKTGTLNYTYVSGGFTWTNTPIWSNTIQWNNGYSNSTSNCHTSIQQGSWWYTNNNTVSTSGTRTYNGDGGQSGRAGNSGFILIYPQWK